MSEEIRRISTVFDVNRMFSEAAKEEIAHVETELRYTGYLEREARVAERMKGFDGAKIPEGFDYGSVKGLRAESRQKLEHFRPESLGQALRISGVTPVDVQLISVILARNERSVRQ